jgi:iron-sulfur cluster assembly protein
MYGRHGVHHGLGGQAGPVPEVVEDKGARVLIAQRRVLGTEMDYRVVRLASRFVFNNPNQKSARGCGESIDLVPAGKETLEGLKS